MTLYTGEDNFNPCNKYGHYKHRPSHLGEFRGQGHLIDEMKAICEGEAPMQHYIFYSPEAGTGKTSLAHIMANALGYTIHKYNASSKRQRGIEFVEDELAPMSRLGQFETIFFLDEADQLTPAAQSALKGVIEDRRVSSSLPATTCQRSARGYNPDAKSAPLSRWTTTQITTRLAYNMHHGRIEYTPEDVMKIAKANQGDLRNAINTAQAYHSLPLSKRQSFLLSLVEPPFDAQRVLTLCFKRTSRRSREGSR